MKRHVWGIFCHHELVSLWEEVIDADAAFVEMLERDPEDLGMLHVKSIFLNISGTTLRGARDAYSSKRKGEIVL